MVLGGATVGEIVDVNVCNLDNNNLDSNGRLSNFR